QRAPLVHLSRLWRITPPTDREIGRPCPRRRVRGWLCRISRAGGTRRQARSRLMDRDTLAETIFRRMAAPYGDAITPALTQQLRISANLAAEDILEQLRPQRSSRVVAMKGAPPIDRDERNRRIA